MCRISLHNDEKCKCETYAFNIRVLLDLPKTYAYFQLIIPTDTITVHTSKIISLICFFIFEFIEIYLHTHDERRRRKASDRR